MADAPPRRTEDQPATQRPARVDWEAAYKGIGCLLLLLILAVTSGAVAIFQVAGGTVGAGLGVCGLSAFGMGLAYLVLRR